jgi:hypothetical protein
LTFAAWLMPVLRELCFTSFSFALCTHPRGDKDAETRGTVSQHLERVLIRAIVPNVEWHYVVVGPQP